MNTSVKHKTAHLPNLSHKDNILERPSKSHNNKKNNSVSWPLLFTRIRSICQSIEKFGFHTVSYMSACGFQYNGNGSEAICKDCGLEVSHLARDMNPFTIHSQRRPDCPFVCSIRTSSSSNIPTTSTSSTTNIGKASTSEAQTNPFKHQEVRRMFLQSRLDTLHETKLVQQARRRTFSHWSHQTSSLRAHMIKAGFFSCNVGDRIICIYCNLICQQWTPDTDDPCEVHRTLSPNCIYVKFKLIRPAVSSINVGDGKSAVNTSDISPLLSNNILMRTPCNRVYSKTGKRHASYATWPSGENLPPVDDLVRAGFFYTGTNTIVTCFYCNGSLQNWGLNDNPMIEHARWFPHCAYARQLCGNKLYRKIQEAKRSQQERARANESNDGTDPTELPNTNTPPPTTNSQQLLIPDESTLAIFVADRLDLPISQRLLDQNFKLSIIKRCWEDQLRLKHDDFVSECDLHMACLILQQQIEHIDDGNENIVIPSIKMKQIREEIKARMLGQTAPAVNAAQTTNDRNQSTPSNPCVLCLTEEKRLLCIPCGHLAMCVACGHSLKACPICGRRIESFIRIYVP